MGAARVEPAPLMEPLTFDEPDELDALEELVELSLLPHAAAPSAEGCRPCGEPSMEPHRTPLVSFRM